jgi:hypothetical protein
MITEQTIFLKRDAEGSIRVSVRPSDEHTNLIHFQVQTSVNDEYRGETIEGTPLNLFLTETQLRDLTKALARSQDLLVMPAFDLEDLANTLLLEPDTLPSDVNPPLFQGFGK